MFNAELGDHTIDEHIGMIKQHLPAWLKQDSLTVSNGKGAAHACMILMDYIEELRAEAGKLPITIWQEGNKVMSQVIYDGHRFSNSYESDVVTPEILDILYRSCEKAIRHYKAGTHPDFPQK